MFLEGGGTKSYPKTTISGLGHFNIPRKSCEQSLLCDNNPKGILGRVYQQQQMSLTEAHLVLLGPATLHRPILLFTLEAWDSR